MADEKKPQSRAHKESAGTNGGGGKLGRPMSDLEKILMGRPLPKRLRPDFNERPAKKSNK